jgi:hypothetical protein
LGTWRDARARAFVMGEPIPPIADASRVSEARHAELWAELGRLSGDELYKRFWELGPHEQLVVINRLIAMDEWPKAFRDAQARITRVNGADLLPAAEQWKNRGLDAALVDEIAAIVLAELRLGRFWDVRLKRTGAMSGWELTVEKGEAFLTAGDLPAMGVGDLGELPPPTGILYNHAQLGPEVMNLSGEPDLNSGNVTRPVWADEAHTKAWNAARDRRKDSGAKQNADFDPARHQRVHDMVLNGKKPIDEAEMRTAGMEVQPVGRP